MTSGLAVRVVAVAAALVGLAAVSGAQDREYRVVGSVQDSSRQPLGDAAVDIRERTSRRHLQVTTRADGSFMMVGLGHGVYDVTVSKEGFSPVSTEWDLSAPQDAMRRVELPPYVLLAREQVEERKRAAGVAAELETAKSHMEAGELDEAVGCLDRVLARDTDNAAALYLKGLCLLSRDDVAGAASLLERVTRVEPTFAAAHVNLGVCRERLGEPEEALESYERALQVDPSNRLALYNAGVLHYNGGAAERALTRFEAILAGAPEDGDALEMAGYCELQLQRPAEALAFLERARAALSDRERVRALDELIEELRKQVASVTGPGPGGGER